MSRENQEKLDFQTKMFLSTLYEGRQKMVAKQLKDVKDSFLRAKGDLPKNMVVLADKTGNNKE